MSYTPNNIYVYLQAFSGAVAGLLGQSKSLVTTPRGANTDTIDIAGAWAQEVDAQWGVSTNPDLFEYEEILNFSTELFQAINPQPSSRSTSPATYTSTVEALMVLLEDGEAYLSSQSITPPSIVSQTAATVVSGQTYNLLTTDAVIRFDTSGGTTGTANMHAPSYIGQQVTFYWWSWNGAQAAPTMNVDAGHKMVPFSGQASAGAAGLVTTDTISTPGASITREWDGTEWTTL